MKHFLLFIFLFSLVLSTNAHQRTIQELQNIAANTLRGKVFSSKPFQSSTTQTAPVCLASPSPSVCVYGPSDGDGFVIMTTDDNLRPVLGYSKSTFSAEHSESFNWWLEQAVKVTEHMTNESRTLETNVIPDDAEPKVASLIQTKWGQDTPYNNLCPRSIVTGRPCLTGCTATATAQVLKYYSASVSGKDSVSYECETVEGGIVSAKFEGVEFDFASMTDSYNKSSSEKARNAVAKLMAHCGIAFYSQYGDTGTSTSFCHSALGLIKYLGYNNVQYFHHLSYPKKDWNNMIYRFLSEEHPLIYCGADAYTGGGHAFILDGYDEEGLVSVNWGWEGLDDGYYDLSLLNPQTFEFSSSHEMIYINPEEPARVPASRMTLGNSLDITVQKVPAHIQNTVLLEFKTTLYNLELEDFNGKIALVADNDEEQFALSIMNAKIPIASGISLNSKNISTNSLANGTYRIYIGSKNNNETTWQPSCATDSINTSYILKKNNGTLELIKENNPGWISAITLPDLQQSDAADIVTIYDANGRLLKQCPRGELNLQEMLLQHRVLFINDGKETRKVSF